MVERRRRPRALGLVGIATALGLAMLGLLPNRAGVKDLPAGQLAPTGHALDRSPAGGPAPTEVREATSAGERNREDAEADGGAEPDVRPDRKRGITPPWREHAIPELRDRPGRRVRQVHA